MTLRESLLHAIGESCAVARPSATQPRNCATDPTLSALLAAAMRAAAHWKDDPEAWRLQCLEVPHYLHGDLLDHLSKTYPPK